MKTLLIIGIIMAGEWVGQLIGGIVGGIGTHRQNQENQRLMDRYAKRSTTWTIRQCMAFGIHPAKCMGVNPASGPTIPMQNPLGHVSGALAATQIDPDSGINRELKEYALREAKRQEQDSKWRNSILIPVTHPDLKPGQKLWAFNSRFAMFGTLAQTLVLAKNADQAWNLIMKGATPEERKHLQDMKNKIKRGKRKKQRKEMPPYFGPGGM